MCEPIEIGNFLASKNEKGHWIYKAKDNQPVVKKKVDPKYKEKPQFGIQYQIEGNAKAKVKLNINNTVIAIIKLLK